MQRITPFLWFDNQAEAAAKFYTSIFKKSKITNVTHYGEAVAGAVGRPKGSVMTVEFELEGQHFVALNGGPVYKFNPAISFMVNCDTQAELDRYWKKLSAGGKEIECGWLTDKFGVSWQIVPSNLGKLLDGSKPEQVQRVMAEVMKMTKLNIKKMKQAAAKK